MLKKYVSRFAVLLAVWACLAAPAVHAGAKDIALPGPKPVLGVDLMQALMQRMSVRSYSDQSVPLDAVATVLWAGYGINRSGGKHTVPTARGSEVLDLYVAFDTGTFRYDPAKHALIFMSGNNVKGRLSRGGTAARAPFVVVLVGKPEQLPSGTPREDRAAYVNCTAGAAAENMYLAAGALDLGTVIMASIKKDEIVKALNLPGGSVPLYVMPFGYRR